MNNNNYYTIQGWMRNMLQLKGNELMLFALIYGFSQDGETVFNGSLTYMEKAIGATRPTVVKTLNALVEKGLITRISSKKGNKYFTSKETKLVKNLSETSKETKPKLVKNLSETSKETLPNNIDNNNNNYIDKDRKTVRHKYGEYKKVTLSDEELEKLKDKFSDYKDRIQRLDDYIATSGKAYKSHYATICVWAKKDKQGTVTGKASTVNKGVMSHNYTEDDYNKIWGAMEEV